MINLVGKSINTRTELERVVLGSCLLHPETLQIVTQSDWHLHVDDFHEQDHVIAFIEMQDMANKGLPVDSLAFVEKLNKRKDNLGGVAFVSALVDAAENTAVAVSLMRVLHEINKTEHLSLFPA